MRMTVMMSGKKMVRKLDIFTHFSEGEDLGNSDDDKEKESEPTEVEAEEEEVLQYEIFSPRTSS